MPFMRILAAALTLLALSDLEAAIPYPPEKEKWITTTSGEFHIISNASERETRQVVTALTRMREAIGKVTRLKVRAAVPVHVYLLRDQRTFAPYRDAIIQRRDANITGVFLKAGDAKYIVLRGDVGAVDSVVFHELTHYFLDNTAAGLPVWFSEGMAEYYSTFSARADYVNIGAPIVEHVVALRQSLMPLSVLFTVDVRSPEYNEAARKGIFYAQSWALVHFLMQAGPERQRQLGQFVTLAAKGIPAEQAFSTAFGAGYETLQEELRQYVNRRVMQYRRYPLEELAVPEVPAPQPLTRAQALTALGHLLSRANAATLGDAQAYFGEALRLDPSLAEAHAGMGVVHEIAGRAAESQASLERAVALDSKDLGVYLAYGAQVLRRILGGLNGPAGAAAEDVKRARELFERATQLDPSSARAWGGLGATWIGAEGDAAAGIAALEKSLALAPAQEDVAFNLVQLYARAGRRDEAQRLVDSILARSRDPELARQGREAVLLADVTRAEALYGAGDREGALAIMRAVAGETTNTRLGEYLQKVIAETEAQEAERKQIAVINAAIKRANDGRPAEAVKMLDELLPQLSDGEMKTQVKKLRDEMAGRRR